MSILNQPNKPNTVNENVLNATYDPLENFIYMERVTAPNSHFKVIHIFAVMVIIIQIFISMLYPTCSYDMN